MGSTPVPLRRIRVVFSGRVQGVGFRFTALELARRRSLSGFVRNLPDGDVELEAEGVPDAVAGLLQDIDRSHLGSRILSRHQVERPLAGDADFSIRY